MTDRTQITAIIGFFLALLVAWQFSRCNNHIVGGNNMITTDSSLAITQPQPTTAQTPATLYIDTGSVQYKTVWRTKYRDTGSVRIDSFFRDLPPFSLQGAEFVTAKKDTITAQYRYPANQFEYEARYSPDTVLTITTREYIAPNKLQFGAQIGAGIAVGIDGIVRPAAFVGVGVNYRF
jgi:hypothetical protein